jgi:hypothetical protein
MMLKREPKPDLDTAIKWIRGELNGFINAKTKEELYLAHRGLPEPVCRQLIMRGEGCRCAVVERLLKEEHLERKTDG